ncbi:MAG: gamma-glutamylcyclotransferase [Blastocatellia bacterium]|nr:gamma-glutamylcyclotransferase [Blastocatellia bacterium]
MSERNTALVIFVYGTLLRGESNHHLLAEAEFLGCDALPKTWLCTNGRYPAIRRGYGVTSGETYLVTEAVLAALDALEDHPFLYQRRIVRLASRQTAWVYFGNQILMQKMWLIPSGNWRVKN